MNPCECTPPPHCPALPERLRRDLFGPSPRDSKLKCYEVITDDQWDEIDNAPKHTPAFVAEILSKFFSSAPVQFTEAEAAVVFQALDNLKQKELAKQAACAQETQE
mgnify:FL=1